MRATKPPAKPSSSLVWIGAAAKAYGALAVQSAQFKDSDDFLLAPEAYDFGFYVVEAVQEGVSAIDLIRLIRRRSAAGLVAVSTDSYVDQIGALEAGADAVAGAGAPVEHVQAVIASVRRRAVAVSTVASQPLWTLLDAQRTLQSPDGTSIALSLSDLAIMRSFAAAEGKTVSRSCMAEALWGKGSPPMDGALHAALYRLRKRIEQSGQPLWPIYAVAGVGYEFRAPLRQV